MYTSQRVKAIYLSLILPLTSFVACGGNGAATDSVADNLEAADSIAVDSIVIEEVEPVKPDLSTTEAQVRYMLTTEDSSKYLTGILLQMAEDAPEYCQKILESDSKRFIIVDKGKMKLFLYDIYGNVEKQCGIACAKNYGTKHKKGDSRTTEGFFNVKGIFDSTEWLFTDDNGYTSPTKGQYGPRFIRLTIPYIGIHGTGSPSSIGRRCSHGCIRVTNKNIMELVELVEPGMPVIISPGPRDMAVNKREGAKILSVATEVGSPKAIAEKYVEPKPVEEKPDTSMKADTVKIDTVKADTSDAEIQPSEAEQGDPSQ